MNILIINTIADKGGAAIAANRLMQALNKNGVSAKMLTLSSLGTSVKIKFLRNVCFLWERLIVFFNNGFSRKNLFRVSLANSGFDISQHPLIQQADILHLHWINRGFLSLKNIEQLMTLNKPIVWTQHDMWACTGICHHARDCENYYTQCHSCFYLNSKSSKDLSSRVFNHKKKIFTDSKISLVTCSQWLQNKVLKSGILKNCANISIPNPIDMQIYCPQDKTDCRTKLGLPQDKVLLLFGAANSTDERKGLSYFLESLEILKEQRFDIFERIEIVLFGEVKQEIKQRIVAPIHILGYISTEEKIVQLYNAVDAFVISSLDENLPNSIMESMSCGTPCMGFKTGGIPEMIEHKQNGYVATYCSSEDLANGVVWLLEQDRKTIFGKCVEKVEQCYDEKVVAQKYVDLYARIS